MLGRFSHVWLFATLWTVACQAPLSMGFSRQEYWSGLPYPPPRDLPDPGIKPTSPAVPALQADSLPLSHQGSPTSILLPLKSLALWYTMRIQLNEIGNQSQTESLNFVLLPLWNAVALFIFCHSLTTRFSISLGSSTSSAFNHLNISCCKLLLSD